MALNSPERRGLRVFHNSNTAQKVTVVVPAGASLEVPLDVAAQMNAASSHFEVDAAELANAKKEADAEATIENERAAAAHHREYHRLPKDEPATAAETVPQAKKPRKAVKKTASPS